MTTSHFMTAACLTLGLAVAPLAAEGKNYTSLRHDVSTMQSAAYGTSGLSTPPSETYGTSGTSVGTVTAPSVGSYNWPSVGVTNAVPTWRNTNPPVRR
ncbi:hypothetical protein ACVW1A_004610 [Bradyrhizobium sp. LB1.3]|jgi:hypothetical protein|uniref:hypothetical protein n=1 Tax=Bradyrhizobium sp. 184 TaxID=2782653 RepID=UPI001FFAD292|nr:MULTISPECIES: hypothetical protein [unclassified Bradyrhizobium]